MITTILLAIALTGGQMVVGVASSLDTTGYRGRVMTGSTKSQVKKRVVHRRKGRISKVSLPQCTPNVWGDPVPYKGTPYEGTLTPYLVPLEKGIGVSPGKLYIDTPSNDLLFRYPTEQRPLEIKEGTIGKSLALTGIYLGGIVVPFNGWETNPSVKGGDYVLVSKDDLQKLMRTDIFIKLFQTPKTGTCSPAEVGLNCVCRTTLEEPHTTTCYWREGK